jgi:H+-transporting ATPase
VSTVERPRVIGGLSSAEAQQRLRQYGPNAMPEEHPRLILLFLRKLWGPVPWMLEVSIVLELALGKYVDAIITAILLLVNAVLSFAQETRAQNALALLRQKLTINARVVRDDRWQLLPAQELVPGDIVRLRTGDIVPADLHVTDGQISADQSALTGESTPAGVNPSDTAYAGSVVKCGEATGEITTTGPRTHYGKTAELVHTAKTVSHLETTILDIVKYLVAMDVALVIAILVYVLVKGLSFADVLPFSLILLIASVPVALPATFTLATALGSLELSRRGVVVARLSAVEEAVAMNVLCSDKTGTITRNQLALAAERAYPPHTSDDLLSLAAIASDEASQDPIDLAILAGVRARGIQADTTRRLQFIPFDPMTKRTEALVQDSHETKRVVKGIPHRTSDSDTRSGCSLDSRERNGLRLGSPGSVGQSQAFGAKILFQPGFTLVWVKEVYDWKVHDLHFSACALLVQLSLPWLNTPR